MRTLSHPDSVLLAAAYLHVPARRLRALVRGSEADLREWIEGDPSRKVRHARHQAREACERLAKLGARLITLADPAYPKGLLDLEDPPAFLCVRGEAPVAGLAVIGSRTPPAEAAELAQTFAGACGEPVVSGLALGIDAAAHHGALAAKIPTIAYVATGLGVTYPPQHRDLEEEIVASGGAVMSERLPDEPVTKWALVHRDRLQAAHARATILIASEPDGGAMQTMQFAKTLGRPRFVLDRRGTGYGGNEAALRDGGHALPFDVDAALAIIAHAR